MTRNDVIAHLRSNMSGFLATIETDEPRVRGMRHYITEAGDIVFHTGRGKDVGRQLVSGSQVEYCVLDPKTFVQVRIRGEIEELDDPTLVDALIADRPFLGPMLEKIGRTSLLVVRIVKARAFAWTMDSNFAPKEFVEL